MALGFLGGYVAGFASGWVARSTVGSSREAVVKAIALAHRMRNGVKRIVAEQVELVEDLFAEGRARYEASESRVVANTAVRPHVVARAANDPRQGTPSERAA